MIASTFERERLACWPIGELEFVVESLRRGRLRKWFILRPHGDVATRYRARGVAIPRGCRLVVEARTLEPVGVLASEVPPPAQPPAGFNPYFDVPPT
jgi:hypothetical protein